VTSQNTEDLKERNEPKLQFINVNKKGPFGKLRIEGKTFLKD